MPVAVDGDGALPVEQHERAVRAPAIAQVDGGDAGQAVAQRARRSLPAVELPPHARAACWRNRRCWPAPRRLISSVLMTLIGVGAL